MQDVERLINAHRHSSFHRNELLASESCGCFYCLDVYAPAEIVDWVDEDQCALCAKCGIDSVIGSNSGFPITREFLAEMSEYWFQSSVVSTYAREAL